MSHSLECNVIITLPTDQCLGAMILDILWHWSKRNCGKRHLRKLSHSTLWCENGSLALQSVASDWKKDFACETKGICGYTCVNILCQFVYINVYVQIHWTH